MGQEVSDSISFNEEKLTRNRFEFVNIIGRGGFGKVWKVIEKKYKMVYAMKEMQKVRVIDKKSINSIKNERELLSFLRHPFLVNMHFSFQDYDNLYLILDYLQGGDLRYHVSRHRRFSEEQTRFFIACIIVALEYIHSNHIIHRDIKPENLVFDENGYLRLTDFGIAKRHSAKNSHETSGTPGYMSPEVMKGKNHSYGVDYFAVGVIGYEFMLGRRPYVGKTRKEIKELMMSKQVQIQFEELPNGWSAESMDFINKLIQRKLENRLGYNAEAEIKDHPWLKFYPWDELIEKKLQSPFLLSKKDNYDKKYCEQPDKIGLDTLNRYEEYKQQEDFASLFEHFTYCKLQEERKRLQKPQVKLTKVHTTHIKKNHSKNSIGFSRHENHNSNEKQQQTGNYTLNSNGNKQSSNSKRQQEQTMTIALPKTSSPISITKCDLGRGQRISSSFHSNSNIKTSHNYNSINQNISQSNHINSKENDTVDKPRKKFTRSVSALSSSPYSNPNRAVEYIQKTKNTLGYRGSMKSLGDFTESSAKKYSVLSSASKQPLRSKPSGLTGIPCPNSNQKRQIPRQKVDFANVHNKNVTSQCTPMISTNCTIYPTKKANDKAYLSNISSVVNSLIRDYRINFHSRSLSSSKLKAKTNGQQCNNIIKGGLYITNLNSKNKKKEQ